MLFRKLSSCSPIRHVFAYLGHLLVVHQISCALGIQLVYEASITEELSSGCSQALLADVACDPVVRNFRPGFFYSPETLARSCAPSCERALVSYHDAVKSACGNETIIGSFDLNSSALIVPGMYQYLFRSICLKEGSRYCNNVAATAAFIADPGDSMFNYINSVANGTVPPDSCDSCLVEILRLKAGSPYFDGPVVASLSVYQSLTSSCRVTGRPLSTSTFGFYTQEPIVTPAPCAGKTYLIQPSDNCYSISLSQRAGTAWLLAENNLPAYCDRFPTSGNLCIANTCNVYTVQPGDTCNSISQSANITTIQLLAWNPVLDSGCYNLGQMNGTQLCISAPGEEFMPPGTTDLASITPTTAASVPSNTAAGSNAYCGRWYSVQIGDYCNLLTLRFAISLQDFIFLNPMLNENCTNLFAEESYCVQPVGDINTYSGRPGYMTMTTGPSVPHTAFSNLPSATAQPYSRLYTTLPLASGTRDDCAQYFSGSDYQFNLTGTKWRNNCQFVIQVYKVDPESFGVWNGLNTTSPDCSFKPGVRYCGSWYPEKDEPPQAVVPTSPTPPSSTTTTTPSGPKPPAPTHSGQPPSCDTWHVVVSGDTCATVAAKAGITLPQFLSWNPAVSADCSQNFWLDYAYCVHVASSSSTATTSRIITKTTSSSNPTPTRPPAEYTQPGIAPNCTKYDRAKSGDYCALLAERNSITLAQLARWNPVLGVNGADCATNFWLNYYYCVGVPS
ncbi:LysM domain-containing protein [Apiosordaria backusii]|uniref:LysM domain-containing protein n=1 Tax=Apiosordaria backusii TaxID=314023 RepID=A0AA40BMD2_9PEZI|nr:LysM domain-containing protein [Apiosordaria backusii]